MSCYLPLSNSHAWPLSISQCVALCYIMIIFNMACVSSRLTVTGTNDTYPLCIVYCYLHISLSINSTSSAEIDNNWPHQIQYCLRFMALIQVVGSGPNQLYYHWKKNTHKHNKWTIHTPSFLSPIALIIQPIYSNALCCLSDTGVVCIQNGFEFENFFSSQSYVYIFV